MSLDNPNVIDAIGLEDQSDLIMLTIADAWDWEDEHRHLLALQAKLNAYFRFIESGEIWESYPTAIGKRLVINVIGRYPIPSVGTRLLESASIVSTDLNVDIRSQHYLGTQ